MACRSTTWPTWRTLEQAYLALTEPSADYRSGNGEPSGALFLIFGEGPSDDMTTASARATLAAWALAAPMAGGWRLLRTDAKR